MEFKTIKRVESKKNSEENTKKGWACQLFRPTHSVVSCWAQEPTTTCLGPRLQPQPRPNSTNNKKAEHTGCGCGCGRAQAFLSLWA